MKKKVSKSSKRRLVVFGIPALAIIIYSLFTISYYSVSLLKVESLNKNLETELKSLQNDEENLRIEIQKLKDPEYVARYARENYFYSKDGEKILKLEGKEEQKKEEEVRKSNNIYMIVIGICSALVLIVMIMRKNKPAQE